MQETPRDQSKILLFEQTPIPKAVLTLIVPTVMSSLVMVLYNLADTFFVSYLNNPVQNAAVTLAAPVLLAFNAVNNLFGSGAGTAISRGLGRKDYAAALRYSAFGIYGALMSAILFSTLSTLFRSPLLQLLGAGAETTSATSAYLFWTCTCGAVPAILNVVMANMVRSEGSTLHASVGTMSGCLLNILLDPFFILPFGLNMGAAGAGLATFISNCVACSYFLVLLFLRRKKTYVCLNPLLARPSKAIVKEIFSVGIPASIQNLLNVTGMTVLNNFTSAFGTNAVAAMGIAYKLNMIPLYVNMGISQGIMPLIGYTYAGKLPRRMKDCLFFTLRITGTLTVCMLLFYLIFAPQLIALFIQTEEIVQIGSVLLRYMCLGIPFLAMDFTGVGVYQACGRGHISLGFAISRKIVLEIPALFLLNRIYPLYGLGLAQFFTEFVLAIAAVLVLRRLLRQVAGQGVG